MFIIEHKFQTIIDFLPRLDQSNYWEIIGTIATIIGLAIAIIEFKKSREATELSNRQSLFEKRLACYFKNKKILGEVTNNLSCLKHIVNSNKKQRGGYINIAFQLFFDASSIYNNHLSSDDANYLIDFYNKKMLNVETLPDETRILYSFKEIDSGLFADNYIAMLYHLFFARQLYGRNAPAKKIEERYKQLCEAINELEEIIDTEKIIINNMRDELDLEKTKK